MEGRAAAALKIVERELDAVRADLGITFLTAKLMIVEALEAAFELGETAKIEELLEQIEELRPGERPPLLAAHAARFRARLAGTVEEADRDFRRAAQLLDELGAVFWRAVVQLEHAERLTEEGRAEEAEALCAEARETFERLEATPWVERARAAAGSEVAA